MIHVRGRASVAEARAAVPPVHALLLDSGNPEAARRELSGTGRVHDWEIGREIVATVRAPVFLAGVSPFGVDLCNADRTVGKLDAVKPRAFIAAAAGA